MIYIRIIYLTVISYYLLQWPEALGTFGVVVLLGQAMKVPLVFLDSGNPLTSVLAFFFGMLALTDLVPILLENISYFDTIIPIRTTVYFLLAGYMCVVSSPLANSLMFTYVFFEVWINFITYNNLRDEKYYRFKKFMEENPHAFDEAAGEQVRVEID